MASAVIGSLRVNLGIDTAAFDKGLADAMRSLKGIGNSMKSIGSSMSMYLTAPILGFGALTVKTAGDFEAAMNRVGAATGATGGKFEALEDLARDLGRTTTKSASEAADMLEMLAKNGLTTEQILGGAATAAIKLSEATGGDLSTAADVATNVMAQFKIEAKDLGRVVDGVTNVTLASQFGFNDYKHAIAQAGGVAGALGVSLEDFNAAIAGTASVFNSGEDAGTSFKTFLTTLVPKSDAAAAEMKKLGLEFFNANGSMKSMSEIAEELKTSLSSLSDEAKTDSVTTIFGSDAMRTAIALADQGAAGIDKLSLAISRKGSADEQAAARMKGFNGELEKLAGAFDELKLAIADSGLLTTITSLVTKIAEWVAELAKTSPEILKWGTIVAGLTAVLGPVLIVMGTLATVIAAIGAPIALAVAGTTALAAAAVTLYTNWDRLKTSFPEVAAVVETTMAGMKVVFDGLLAHATLVFTGLGQLLQGDFMGAWDTLKAAVMNFSTTLNSVIDTVFPGFKQGLASIVVEAVRVAQELVNAFLAIPGKMLEIGGQIIDGLINGISSRFDALKAKVLSIGEYIPESIRNVMDMHSPSRVMHEIGSDVMQGLTNGITQAAPGSVAAADEAATKVNAAFARVNAPGIDPWKGLRETTTDATSGLSEMENAGQSLASTLGNAFSSMIDGSKKLKDVLKDLASQLGSKLLDSGLNSIFGSLFGGMGGGGAGGGGFLSSIFGGAFGGLKGFANGGEFKVGGAGGIDSKVVAFRASPNEHVSITKPNQQRGGGFSPTYHIDARGSQMSEAQFKRILDENNRKVMGQVRVSVTGWVQEDGERVG